MEFFPFAASGHHSKHLRSWSGSDFKLSDKRCLPIVGLGDRGGPPQVRMPGTQDLMCSSEQAEARGQAGRPEGATSKGAFKLKSS